jgi:hypothetical protein
MIVASVSLQQLVINIIQRIIPNLRECGLACSQPKIGFVFDEHRIRSTGFQSKAEKPISG